MESEEEGDRDKTRERETRYDQITERRHAPERPKIIVKFKLKIELKAKTKRNKNF